ncbi:hypothetical protein ABEG18_23020 [Alsobacter sp. KACC 23698]|uniref:Uncharacterized protein n=1 Tax=Alsobacter sp. KACC 23698 TaxID=3149229 RepID=A0AAU7JE41_9HYPH
MTQRRGEDDPAGQPDAANAAPAKPGAPQGSAQPAGEAGDQAAEKDIAKMFGFADRDGSESWPREQDPPDGETAGAPLPEGEG